MKLYRVNQISTENGKILKKEDILANDDRQAMNAAAELDGPPYEAWREGTKVGTVQ